MFAKKGKDCKEGNNKYYQKYGPDYNRPYQLRYTYK